MFIRIKKIKGLEYAYLVKSVWKDKTARQKVVQYLGKVYTLSKTNTASFETFCKEENKNLENAGLKAIIQALMEWTLWQHSFIKDPLIQKKWLLENGKIVGDPEKLKITSGKKEVTLKINDGYMNSFTLKELLNIQIKKKTEEQRQAATSLAKAFVDAGIQVPQDIFIEVFQKVYQ
ncbi:MAG: hypothetical protein AABX82_09235 [Nanoarchaeota archaeon]